MISRIISLYYRFIKKSWVAIILASLICVALSLHLIGNLRTDFNYYRGEDFTFPAARSLTKMKREFGTELPLYVLFSTSNAAPFQQGQFCRIRSFLRNEVTKFKPVNSITHPFDALAVREDAQGLQNEPYLPLDCKSDGANATPDFQRLKEMPFYNVFFDQDHSHLLAVVHFDEARFDQSQRFAVLDQLAASSREALAPSGINTEFGGPNIFSWYYSKALSHEAIINGAMFLFLFMALRIFAGRWKTAFYLLFVLLFSLIILFGIQGWFGFPISYLTNTLILLVCIAGLEDYIFLAFEPLRAQKAVISRFARLAIPGFFTSLTTVVGFGSLLMTHNKALRDFGLMAATGASVEWVTTFFVLPSLLLAVKKLHPGLSVFQARLTQTSRHFLKWAQWTPGRWVRALLILALLGIPALFYLNLDDNPAKYFSPRHPHTQFYDHFQTSMGWIGRVYLTYYDFDERKAAQLDQHLDEVAALPNVAFVTHPRKLLAHATAGISSKWRPVVERMVKHHPAFKSDHPRTGVYRVSIFVKSTELIQMRSLSEKASQLCQRIGCEVTGEPVIYAESSQQIVDEFFSSTGTSLLLVGMVMLGLLFWFKVRNKLAALACAFWGILVAVAGVAIFRVEMNLITCSFVAILTGMVGDNVIQYLLAKRLKPTWRALEARAVGSIVVSVLCVSCSLFALAMVLVPVQKLGLLIALGFVLALVGDLWVFKGTLDNPERF